MLKILIPALLLSSAAHGAICDDPVKLSEAMKSCADNQKLIDSAEDCLDKISAEVEKAGLNMSFTGGANSKQSANFNAAVSDYSDAAAKLERLLDYAKVVGDEVDNYINFVRIPEDTFSEEISNPNAFADQFQCFAGSRKFLAQIVDEIEKKESELYGAYLIAYNHGKTSAGSESKTEALNSGTVQKGVKQDLNAPTGQGKADSKSGISGTEKLEKKK